MPTTTTAPDIKYEFYLIAQTIWAGTDVQVSFGHPGMTQADDIVSFGALETEQDVAAYGTNRAREETVTLEVLISVFRAGGAEMEKVASDRAYELLAALEQYVRVTDTTVNGTCRHCFLVSTQSDGASNPEVLSRGRVIEVTARFQAKARITT